VGGLQSNFPATIPALLANFIRIINGSVRTSALATSQIFYIYEGTGYTNVFDKKIPWEAGDYLVLPSHNEAIHYCEEEASLYWVHDGPLLNYLGVTASNERFPPALYKYSLVEESLQKFTDLNGKQANRPRNTIAITPTIWTMFGVLPKECTQYPQKHESATIDFIIDCKPGCFTMIGTELGSDGAIVNGTRYDWLPGASFIIPSGYWCSRHNESTTDAHAFSIQDAGLHIYLRTLETAFSNPILK